MRKRGEGKGREREKKRLVGACFGNALSMGWEFDLRSQILVYPSLPQLMRVGPEALDAPCRFTARTEVVPPGWPPRVARRRRSDLA